MIHPTRAPLVSALIVCVLIAFTATPTHAQDTDNPEATPEIQPPEEEEPSEPRTAALPWLPRTLASPPPLPNPRNQW